MRSDTGPSETGFPEGPRKKLEPDTLSSLGAVADILVHGVERKRAEQEREKLLEREHEALNQEITEHNRRYHNEDANDSMEYHYTKSHMKGLNLNSGFYHQNINTIPELRENELLNEFYENNIQKEKEKKKTYEENAEYFVNP